jgi:hypothetical protein
MESDREKLRSKMDDLRAVITGEWESKEAFIARVREVLFSDNV